MPPPVKYDIKTLKKIAVLMERMSPDSRQPAIYWLADYFLGIKWWRR